MASQVMQMPERTPSPMVQGASPTWTAWPESTAWTIDAPRAKARVRASSRAIARPRRTRRVLRPNAGPVGDAASSRTQKARSAELTASATGSARARATIRRLSAIRRATTGTSARSMCATARRASAATRRSRTRRHVMAVKGTATRRIRRAVMGCSCSCQAIPRCSAPRSARPGFRLSQIRRFAFLASSGAPAPLPPGALRNSCSPHPPSGSNT